MWFFEHCGPAGGHEHTTFTPQRFFFFFFSLIHTKQKGILLLNKSAKCRKKTPSTSWPLFIKKSCPTFFTDKPSCPTRNSSPNVTQRGELSKQSILFHTGWEFCPLSKLLNYTRNAWEMRIWGKSRNRDVWTLYQYQEYGEQFIRTDLLKTLPG